jgi:SNF2 family DNA or RNA helicase
VSAETTSEQTEVDAHALPWAKNPHVESDADYAQACFANPSLYSPATRTQQLSDTQILTSPKVERRVVDVVPVGDNPRIRALLEVWESLPRDQKMIVWCRFTRDVDNVCSILDSHALRYDGRTSHADREEALRRFRDPASPERVLVANVHALSHGVTLTIARVNVYYSNDFSLEKRLQSEDRTHRIGQTDNVLIVDLVAENTIDGRVVECLRQKYDVARLVTGDKLREWIGVPRTEEE